MPYNDQPYDQTTNRFGAAPATNTSQLRNWREIYNPTAEVPPWMKDRVAFSWDAVNLINQMPHMFDPSMYFNTPVADRPAAMAKDLWNTPSNSQIGARTQGLPGKQIGDIFAHPSTQGLGSPTGLFGVPSSLFDFSNDQGLLDALRQRIQDAVSGAVK